MEATYTAYKKCTAKHPFTMAFAAPTKAGKTYLLLKLIATNWTHEFDNIVIISPTFEFKDEYPIESIVSKDTRVIKIGTNLQERGRQVIEEQMDFARKHNQDPELHPQIKTLLILDDCIDSRLFTGNRTENIFDMATCRGRHFDLSCVAMSQVLAKISADARRNIEYLFIFAPLNFMDIERVLDEYVPQEYRLEFRKAQREIFKTKKSFILIDGTEEKRTQFEKRITKGFIEPLFQLDEHIMSSNKKKRSL